MLIWEGKWCDNIISNKNNIQSVDKTLLVVYSLFVVWKDFYRKHTNSVDYAVDLPVRKKSEFYLVTQIQNLVNKGSCSTD